jgi:hypothetical protein
LLEFPMSTAPTGEERLGRRVVLVVDLGGQPLAVLAVLEELLADLVAWEESDAADPPHHRAPLRLPAPLAGGVALAAVRRLATALGPTQCLGWERGRLLAPTGATLSSAVGAGLSAVLCKCVTGWSSVRLGRAGRGT